MARSRIDIKREMTDAFMADPNIIEKYDLTPGQTFEQEFSLVSVENILFDNISAAHEEHEKLVELNAKNSRSHNVAWYLEQVFNFHDGLQLVNVNGSFQYDLTNVPDATERMIIARAAVLPTLTGEIVIKVATASGTLSAGQLARFTEYISIIKDAGTHIRIVNLPADSLKITLDVYCDVSIIDLNTGRLLNTTAEVHPVEEHVAIYLANLEFNGRFVTTKFQSELEKAAGVNNPLIRDIQWKFADFDFVPVVNWKIPESGYFNIAPEDLIINYFKDDLANN